MLNSCSNMGGTSCGRSFISQVMKGGWWNNQLQTSVWLLSFFHCLAIELSPVFPPETNRKAHEESKRWLGIVLPFFFFLKILLYFPFQDRYVFTTSFCTLGFTSGIWLLSSRSSPILCPHQDEAHVVISCLLTQKEFGLLSPRSLLGIPHFAALFGYLFSISASKWNRDFSLVTPDLVIY